MSSFLALTPKSSKKLAFLWKRVLEPRKHVWRDFKISKDMHVSSQDMAVAYDSPLFQENLSARLLRKSFPIPPFVPKTTRGGAGESSHFHDHNSLLILPLFLFAPRKSIFFDLFWLHVEFRCITYIEDWLCLPSWPETSCLYVQSSRRTFDGGA